MRKIPATRTARLLPLGLRAVLAAAFFFAAVRLLPVPANCEVAPGKSAQVDQLLSAAADAPGASVLVMREGAILHMKGYGLANLEHRVPNTPQTVFRLGSITKPFTALAILHLHDRGLLDIDDPIGKHLPGAPHGDEITLRHLLTHTSGLGDSQDAPLQFTPGSRLSYSNEGYRLLGRIVEQVSGASYEDYLRDSIFQPLGMLHSGLDHQQAIIPDRAAGYLIGDDGGYVNAPSEDISRAYAAGGLYSTVEDMRIWDQALDSGKLLSPDTLRQAFTPAKLQDGTEAGYGFGWMIGRYRGLRELSHGGDITGFNSWVSRFPDHHLTVVVLSNIGMRPPGPLPDARTLAHQIADIYLSDLMEPAEGPAAITLDPALYADYVGRYRAEGPPEMLAVTGDILTVGLEAGRLFIQDKVSKAALIPESEVRFSCATDSTIKVTFLRDDRGQVTGLIVDLMGLRELRATKLPASP